jgi:hypothetical protein
MTIGAVPDCEQCVHKYTGEDEFGCKAYPEGIPEDILVGEKHTEVRDDQIGKFVYEKRE